MKDGDYSITCGEDQWIKLFVFLSVVFPSGSSLLLEASDNNNARSQASETSPLASTLPTSSPTNPRSPGSAAVNTASDHAPSVGQQESQSTTVPAREQPGNGRQTLLADTSRGSSVAMATVVDGNRGNQVQTGTAAYQMDVETVMVEVSSPPPGTATSFSDVTGGTESPAVEHLSHTLSASLLPTDTGTMATAMTTHTDQQTATQQMQTAASAAERLHPPGPGTQGAEDVELEDSC
ncbi:mucin-2 [Gadus chalcogrammus]|uniref:mucin-2 n=1 Tax=Gadus chalcogrammus TaxID=1042646 RepID=UPI0024C4AB2A|nr:mucin-2 [Gadus chalcogrammus]